LPMRDVCRLIWLALVGLLQSRVSLEVEILALRHQLNVLRRKSPKKLTFTIIDRLVFAGLYRLAPGMLDALAIVETADGDPLASGRFPSVLALEIETSRRAAEDSVGNPSSHSRHEPGQPTLGCSPDSRRTPQARHRRRPNLGRQVYGKAQKASIPRLEDFPPKPRRWGRID
jgi:hypothetical protein